MDLDNDFLAERSLEYAKVVHINQKRKNTGEPYINHPIRIASHFVDPIAKAVAYLHDVIEDGKGQAEYTLRACFPEDVVDAVLLISRCLGETYCDFIIRIRDSNNLVAILVKLADLDDNMNDLDEGSLKDKYRLAQFILREHLHKLQKKTKL